MTTERLFTGLLSLLGWFALVLQYYLILEAGNGTPVQITMRFFFFFTILTNILVAVCMTSLFLGGKTFAKPSTLTAITLYIVVVGIVYNTVLRGLIELHGWNRVVDELLHLVIPVLVLIYWLVFVPKNSLQWKNAWPWTLYPLIYLLLVMIRGPIVHEYPYPFLNVDNFGYAKVAINSGIVCLVFLGLSFLFIAIDKAMKPKIKA